LTWIRWPQNNGVVSSAAGPLGFNVSDHYDPLAKALRLSPHVCDGQSISSVAVAAHEAGHAIQDQVRYLPLVWRSALVPQCNVGSMIWIFPFMAGLLLRQLSF